MFVPDKNAFISTGYRALSASRGVNLNSLFMTSNVAYESNRVVRMGFAIAKKSSKLEPYNGRLPNNNSGLYLFQ